MNTEPILNSVEEAIAILTDEALAPDLKRIRDGVA